MPDERPPVRTWEVVAVGIVLAVAAGLRLYRLDLGWFGVDQARDIATALDIAHARDFPLVGPTMRRVTSLGAVYYYFWTLPYLLWRDPIAGYWFSVFLTLGALVLVWRIARRLWGAYPAFIALTTGAVHPVWIIDSRICWSPAALPAIAVLLLWLALGPDGQALARLTVGRAAALGALLGVALQLHLTMIGWVAAAVVFVLLERPSQRALACGTLAFAVAALPALWPMIAPSAVDAGIGTLPSRGMAAPAGRLVALFLLPLRVPTAFTPLLDQDAEGPLARAAPLLLSALIWAGVGRLGVRAVGSDRAARVLVTVVAIVTVMVVLTPGESWYYYLDSLLPVWALATGALVAPSATRTPSVGARVSRPSAVVGGLVVAVALLCAFRTTTWLRSVASLGYTPVEPSLLSLDSRPGRDAAVAGRLLTVDVKRRVAAAAAVGTDAETLWQRTHGPAFADVTGDNGFWFDWYAQRARARGSSDDGRHVAVWYRDDATAVALASASGPADEIERTTIGPLFVVRYRPVIDYASCRADGRPLTVPARIVPHPKRYGDGTVAMPESLPATIECTLSAGEGATRVVAALGGPGAVAIVGPDATRSTPGRESTRCVQRSGAPAVIRVEVARVQGAATDLDLYDVPMGIGCPP